MAQTVTSRPLLVLACFLALAACSSKSVTPAPDAPAGVSAIAGDRAATVSWESSPGATGYRVYYNADSSGATTTGSLALDAGTALFATVTGLVDGTKYRFAVAARNLTGEGALSAEVVATPVLNAPIAVSATSPVDAATAVSRTASVAVTFNRAALPSSITAQAADGACTGSVQLSSDDFNTCAGLHAAAASNSNQTFTLIPAHALAASATYQLRATTSVRDANGIALTAQFTQAHGFTTRLFAVVSTQPAAGAMGVPLNTNLTLTFNQPTNAASITDNTGNGNCGSVSLARSGQSCIAFTAQPVSLDQKTFTLTPATPLTASTVYTLTASTAALDATLVPLDSTYTSTFTTGTGVDSTPPAEVSGVTATPALQSIALSWINPGDADFNLVRVHQCASAVNCSNDKNTNPVIVEVSGAPGAAGQTVLTGLVPYASYVLRLTTVDQSGNESAGNGDTTVQATTAFSGHTSGAQPDFTSAQRATAVGAGVLGDTVSVWFTWTSSALYVALGNTGGTALLTTNQDVLWLALDTDPDTDMTGETRTSSLGANEVIWPFKADYIAQYIPNGLNSTVQVRAAGGCALIHQPPANPLASDCASIATPNFDGSSGTVNGVSEFAIPLSALGQAAPAKVRLAFAALNNTNGYAYALAPKNPSAIDVIGYFGSLTASFNPGANAFNPAQAANAALASVSPLSPAAGLVTLSVQAASAPSLKGSLHPLSYSLSDVSFALRDDGTGGDGTSGDGIYSGAFNFGGTAQELFFKYGLNGTDEFAANSDRLWTLSGTAESMPQLAYGAVYSENHSFQLTFEVINPQGTSSDKEVVGNVGELGNFMAGSGPKLSSLGSGTWTTAAVLFANHDFVTSPLQWKARDNGSNTWESDWPNGPEGNHEMNDDVLNKRTLSWTWNDYSHDPF